MALRKRFHSRIPKAGNVGSPAQANEWIALWTPYAALGAAIIALGTLVAVGYQIWLGRQELNAVRDDLSLSRQHNGVYRATS